VYFHLLHSPVFFLSPSHEFPPPPNSPPIYLRQGEVFKGKIKRTHNLFGPIILGHTDQWQRWYQSKDKQFLDRHPCRGIFCARCGSGRVFCGTSCEQE
jgi:hypothetical protein